MRRKIVDPPYESMSSVINKKPSEINQKFVKHSVSNSDMKNEDYSRNTTLANSV